MKAKKYIARTRKNIYFEFILMIFRFLIFLLSAIGDGVIIIGKGTLFLLKITFSIIYNLPKLFPVIENLIKNWQIFLKDAGKYLRKKFIHLISPTLPAKKIIYQKRTGFWAKLKRQTILFLQTPIRVPTVRLFKPKPKVPQIPKPHPVFTGFVLGALTIFILVFIPYNLYLFIKLLPNPRLLTQRVIPVTTQIFDRHGELLYEIYDGENRKPMPLSQIPQYVKQATISIEDRNFYLHPGFSLRSIARAAWETFFNHRTQGGSTLTQQLIKNALLTQEITLSRKLREIVLAFWAERIYSKDQILEMYLNQVPYGGTAWGIEAAAQTYFGKSAAQLDLAEAAYLAGLPAAPTYFSPYGSHPELAKDRQIEVLARMTEDGYISQKEAEQAKSAPLDIRSQVTNIKAPHFVMYIRELLSQKLGTRLVDQGGLRITTTLDLPLQEKTEEIVSSNIAQLQRLHVGNGAALITNPQNGDILAMVGSKNYFDPNYDGKVNVALSLRQPGSAIKIVTYATALENGLTAASLINDAPVAFSAIGQPTYAPQNYDSRFHGIVTLRSAFANSYNVPAVKVLNQIGLENMIDVGKRLGITTWDDQSRFGLSLTLGGGEVRMIDLATVFGTMANQGQKVNLDPFLKVTDYTGKVYFEKKVAAQPEITPQIAFIISDILSDNQARTPAFGPNSALVIPGKTVAVKTGTTNDKRDNWTLGYTPSVVVGVWVGNNDNSPMDPYLTSGITGAAPIWHEIMVDVLKDKSNEAFSPPADIISLPCRGRTEYFIKGTQPKGGCAPLPSPQPSPSQ